MAAFSATLNISSTAKVNPNSEDFNIKVYGFSESMDLDELINNFTPQLLSDTISMPNIRGIGKEQTFNPAKISNNKNTITISDIQTQYKNTFGSIEYYFIIQNEGKYNATIAYSEFQKYFDNTYDKECIYDETVSSTLGSQVCENIEMYIALAELDPANELLNSATGTTQDFNDSYVLIPGNAIFLCIGIHSSDSSVLPDGDMQINFEDLELVFTTTPPSEN